MAREQYGVTNDGAALELMKELHQSEKIDDQSEVDESFNIFNEARHLFHIALPSVLIQFSLFFIFPLSASAVGRTLGTVELGGFSLGSLIGNLTCLSIMEGALTAADTLMPRAYGAERYREVGRLAIRGAAVCAALLLIAFVPLMTVAGSILQALGQDPRVSHLAEEWIRYYFIGAPPILYFRVVMRFLLAQHQPWPLVWSSGIPCVIIQPILLRLLVPNMGLPGSALAISLSQWCTALILFITVSLHQYHNPETWPGLSWAFVKESLHRDALYKFAHLSLGGILSMNEWWFFEIMCFIAGSFGVISLCVHTIAYNLVPLLFMIPLGIMVGLTVRMGHVITYDPVRAKKIAIYTMEFTVTIALFVCIALYVFQDAIIRSFTLDLEVIEGAKNIWINLCIYIFLIYIFGINQAILRALGMQWRLASIITISLYCFTLPAVLYFAVIRGGGLQAQWNVLPVFYVFLQISLVSGYALVDWDKYSKGMREALRISRAKDLEPTEESFLFIDNGKGSYS